MSAPEERLSLDPEEGEVGLQEGNPSFSLTRRLRGPYAGCWGESKGNRNFNRDGKNGPENSLGFLRVLGKS